MIAIVENMRAFCTNRPPLVLFIICLCSFIGVLFTVTFVIKDEHLRNPDVKKDWNTFLEKVSDVDFCLQENVTGPVESSPKIKEVLSNLHSELKGDYSVMKTPDPNEIDSNPDKIINVFLPLFVEVTPTSNFLNNPHNVTQLTSTLSSADLSFEGGNEAESKINITFALNYNWTSLCKNEQLCERVIIQTCVRLEGKARLFPTSSMPDICPQYNETSNVEFFGNMISKKREFGHRLNCGKSPSLQVKYKLDPRLVVMLSLEDRSLINLHLVHTSYFLFVMVVTLLCYAIIRGKPKPKASHINEKV